MADEKKLKERALKALDAIAYQEKFNAFRVMKNGEHEIRHSNILAWLFEKKRKKPQLRLSVCSGVLFCRCSRSRKRSVEKMVSGRLYREDRSAC